jgi:hypothetical protein
VKLRGNHGADGGFEKADAPSPRCVLAVYPRGSDRIAIPKEGRIKRGGLYFQNSVSFPISLIKSYAKQRAEFTKQKKYGTIN